MPPSSTALKQAEETLEEVLQTVRREFENPNSVLCETDRNKFVEEEESIREQIKEMVEAQSNSWRNLLCLPSPQAVKCLKDAEELRQHVKEDINAKLRTRLTGKSSPPSSSHGQRFAFNLTGTRAPEADTRLPPADSNPERASTIITSPLNMRCGLPKVTEIDAKPAVQNRHDHTSDLNEAINTPLETSGDQSRSVSSQRRRRAPPPPPLRRIAQSADSRVLSVENSVIASPLRSPSVRRPAPPPPQSPRRSTSFRSPPNGSLPPPGTLPPNHAAMMSAMSQLGEQVNKMVSSLVNEGKLPPHPRGGQAAGQRYNGSYVSKTNCVDIKGSNVDGLTMNNGGTNNTGAVIHKTVSPHPRLSQPVP